MRKNNWRCAGVSILFGVLLVVGLGSIPILAQANYDGEREAPVVTGEDGSHFEEIPVDLGTDPEGTFMSAPAGVQPDPLIHLDSPFTEDCGNPVDETPPPGCFLGYAADRYDFTLTQAADVTVEVADRFNAGDRYEARCNNRNLDEDGNGDFNNHGEDCIFEREDVDVGVEVWANLGTVTLDPGDWSIRIREFELQCGTFFDPLDPFFPDSACPAGFRVRINFSAPTGTECEGIPSCFNEDNVFGVNVDDCPECLDTSLPRSAPCPPPDDPRGKGFWKRVCKKHHPSGERENLPDYVAFVNTTDTFFHVENARGICSELHLEKGPTLHRLKAVDSTCD